MSTELPRNIQIFNRIVAFALSELYDAFPVPTDIDPSVIGTRACDGFTEDQNEIFDIIASIASETIEFLAEEGLIRYERANRAFDGPSFPSARLSMQGLILLGKVPAEVDASAKGRTIGTQIRAAADKGAADYLSSLVGQLFGAAVGAGWKAVSG